MSYPGLTISLGIAAIPAGGIAPTVLIGAVDMKCVECSTVETDIGKTSVTLIREGKRALVVHDVAALLCPACGAQYPDVASLQRVLSVANESASGWYLL
jgi:YgiT-type zinc finger domain-containing protein